MKNSSVEFLYAGAKIIGNQYVPDRFNYAKRINLNKCIIGGTFFIDAINYQNGSIVSI
jgi:hypothetical protein